jgi:hypothetical protein
MAAARALTAVPRDRQTPVEYAYRSAVRKHPYFGARVFPGTRQPCLQPQRALAGTIPSSALKKFANGSIGSSPSSLQ